MGFNGTLTIGKSVTSIGDKAFYLDENLAGITFLCGKPNLGTSAFELSTGSLKTYVVVSNGWANDSGNFPTFRGTSWAPMTGVGTDGGIDWLIDPFSKTFTIGPADNPQDGYEMGQMRNYDGEGTTPWDSIRGEDGYKLKIESGVINIGDYAFKGFSKMTGVLTIPDSVTTIGNLAFCDCNSFTGKLAIPDNVTTIGNYAFCSNHNITSITIGKSVQTIGEAAFAYCNHVAGALTIPDSVTTIGANAFKYTGQSGSGLTYLVIGTSVTDIGNEAFAGAKFTVVVFFGDKPTTALSGQQFNFWPEGTHDCYVYSNGWTNSTTDFPDCNNTKFPDANRKTFDSSGGIYYAKFSDGIHSYMVVAPNTASKTPGVMPDYDTVGPWDTITTSGYNFIIASGVKNIGNNAFNGCTGLTGNLIIPDTVTSIGENAFYGCTGFTGSLMIQKTVTSIGANAFKGCSNFSQGVTFFGGAPELGTGAFDLNGIATTGEEMYNVHSNGWASDTTVFPAYDHTKWLPTSMVDGGIMWYKDTVGYRIVISPALSLAETGYTSGEMKDYTSVGPWGTIPEGWTLTLESGVTKIGNYAFYGSTSLAYVNVSRTVTTIGNHAFEGCSDLVAVYMNPTIVPTLGTTPFDGCDNIKFYTSNVDGYEAKWGSRVPDGSIVSNKIDVPVLADLTYNGSEQTVVTPVTPNYTFGGALEGTDADTYTATATLNPDSNLTWDDGSTVDKDIDWTIGKATLSAIEDKTRAYYATATQSFEVSGVGTESVTVTYTAYSKDVGTYTYSDTAGAGKFTATLSSTNYQLGSVGSFAISKYVLNNDAVEAEYDGSNNISVGFTGPGSEQVNATYYAYSKDVGTYMYSATAGAGKFTVTMTNTNYEIGTLGDFTITQKEVSLTWNDIADLVYSKSEKTPTVTVGGIIDGDTVNVTIALTTGKDNVNVGTFTFTATAIDNGNYKLPTDVVSKDYTITQKAVTVTADDMTKIYGETDPTLTATVEGTCGTDTVAYTLERVEGEDAGTYTITVIGDASQGNYSVSFKDGTFTIERLQIDKPTAVTGLVYDGTVQTGVEDGTGYTVTDGTGTNAGSYTATVTLDGNHKWSDGSMGELSIGWTIAPKDISGVTVEITSTYTYNGSEQTVTFTVTDGDPSIIAATDYSVTSGDKGTNADTYTLVLTGANNYTGTITTKWTIAQKAVVVSGITALDKEYDGTTKATLDYTNVSFEGIIKGDTLTVTAIGTFDDAEPGTGKIVYITQLTLGGSSNYKLASEGQQTQTTASITAITYVVSFINEDGETVAESKTIVINHTVDEPTIKLKDNEVIAGWYNGNLLWNFSSDVVTSDLTLVVKISINFSGEVIVVAEDKTAADVEVDESVTKVIVILSDGIVEIDNLRTDKNLMVSIEKVAAETDRYDVITLLGEESYTGKITISLPYNVDKTIAQVYYYPESGDKVLMDATFYETTGMATFVTDHNSVYGIEYASEPAPVPSSSNGSIMLLVIMVVVIIAAVLGMVVYIIYSHRDE